ncbi:MAG: VTT domain-containing protein [Woeseia sp.]
MIGKAAAVLEEGRTVWKVAHADRVAVLVDAADYFSALRKAMLAARRSIVVLGWDIDSRTPLVGRSGKAEDGAPRTFLPFLEALAKRRPKLDIRLLLWDYTLLYALDREPLPSLNLRWRTPPQVSVALDDCLPLGASHHQKIVVIDGRLGFCGGIDITLKRWDTSEHLPLHPGRVDADEEPYPPVHDVQMFVDGEAGRRLSEVSIQRWQAATGERFSVADSEPQWPDGLVPDCEDVTVGIARTMPETERSAAVTEVLQLYLATVKAAHRYIYIENQYLTSDAIAEAMAKRLREVPDLELVLVTPRAPEGWLEKRTMGAGQQRIMRQLLTQDFSSRVRFLYPSVGSGKPVPILVHAKLMIVDDVLIRVGSSNLNNRSMGVDTECDLVATAETEKQREGIRSVLHRLLSEHLGVKAGEVADQLKATGSIIQVTESLGGRPGHERRLSPLKVKGGHGALEETLILVADPEEPIRPVDFVGDMLGADERQPTAFSRILRLASVAIVLLGMVLAWNFTPLAELADPDALVTALEGLRGNWWIYPVILGLYMLGGLVLFPVTVLIAVTGLLLGPLSGWFWAMVGCLASAWIGYGAGRWLGGTSVQHISGRAFWAVSAALRNRGMIAVAALRMVPVAPFTVVNLAIGAAGVRARVYLAGTFLGMLPGTFILTMLGDRLREAWRDPALANVLLFGLVIGIWLGLAFLLQRFVSRLSRRES